MWSKTPGLCENPFLESLWTSIDEVSGQFCHSADTLSKLSGRPGMLGSLPAWRALAYTVSCVKCVSQRVWREQMYSLKAIWTCIICWLVANAQLGPQLVATGIGRESSCSLPRTSRLTNSACVVPCISLCVCVTCDPLTALSACQDKLPYSGLFVRGAHTSVPQLCCKLAQGT